jgi:hypothetical protein
VVNTILGVKKEEGVDSVKNRDEEKYRGYVFSSSKVKVPTGNKILGETEK